MQKDDKEVRVAMNRQDPPYGCLTNGAHYPFTLNGKTWPTVVNLPTFFLVSSTSFSSSPSSILLLFRLLLLQLLNHWVAWQDHYFHAQKFVGTPLEETIRRCKTAKQAGRAGRAKGAPVRQDWDKIRHNVMYEVRALSNQALEAHTCAVCVTV
jgi:predicted NAD-dependent protein-ADP-ribosyltransferase YbiA (DUF1768 family)